MVLSVLAFDGLVYGLSSIGVIVGGGRDARIAATVLVVGGVGPALFVWRQLVRVERAGRCWTCVRWACATSRCLWSR